jgi:hypothetical protein
MAMVFSSHQKINFFDAVSDHPESQKPSLVSGGFSFVLSLKFLHYGPVLKTLFYRYPYLKMILKGWLFILMLVTPISWSYAQENINPYDVQVSTRLVDSRFQIQASYTVPINICNAHSFITDYEGAKSIPGILESRVISRAGNKVRVYRLIEEQILFFPIEMKSVVEYTEASNRLLTFEQISGDVKFYKGSWRLISEKDATTFKYESLVEPHSLIPSSVIEYFIRSSLKGRFELMAQKASQYKSADLFLCK